MKVRLIALGLLLTLMTLSFSHNVLAQPPTQAAKQEFAAQYKKATSETERMQLAISAINSGLIYRGMPIENVDALFGHFPSPSIPTKGQPPSPRIVSFIPPVPPPPGPWGFVMKGGTYGWYLSFVFDELARVEDYFFTNLH